MVVGPVVGPVVAPPPLHLALVAAARLAASDRTAEDCRVAPLAACERALSASACAGVLGCLAASRLAFWPHSPASLFTCPSANIASTWASASSEKLPVIVTSFLTYFTRRPSSSCFATFYLGRCSAPSADFLREKCLKLFRTSPEASEASPIKKPRKGQPDNTLTRAFASQKLLWMTLIGGSPAPFPAQVQQSLTLRH